VDFSVSSSLGTTSSHDAAESDGAVEHQNEPDEQAPPEIVVEIIAVVVPAYPVLPKAEK
jgi:hypothetical protein